MKCQLHKFLHNTEDNARHTIKYRTIISQDNCTVCA